METAPPSNGKVLPEVLRDKARSMMLSYDFEFQTQKEKKIVLNDRGFVDFNRTIFEIGDLCANMSEKGDRPLHDQSGPVLV